MTNLAQRIPTRFRSPAYVIFALIGVGLGSVPTYCAATGAGVPTWVLGALAVYAYVGGAIGLTASANTPDQRDGLYLERDE